MHSDSTQFRTIALRNFVQLHCALRNFVRLRWTQCSAREVPGHRTVRPYQKLRLLSWSPRAGRFCGANLIYVSHKSSIVASLLFNGIGAFPFAVRIRTLYFSLLALNVKVYDFGIMRHPLNHVCMGPNDAFWL